jgi:hypothetical protein
MTFQLSEIVPWGRSFEEYVAMFALSEDDLSKRILGCGDGPASFNCELTKCGGTAISVDPLYAFDAGDIGRRIEETFDTVMQQTRRNINEFVWGHIRSLDELGEVRMKAMRVFLSDYRQGKADGRYLAESLPSLSFPNNSFDLGLCSHFLFLYSDHLDLVFHIDSIRELCRVCTETRIFPLLQLGAVSSPHVLPVCEHFKDRGYKVARMRVPYEFQRGGNEMLTIRRDEPADTGTLDSAPDVCRSGVQP